MIHPTAIVHPGAQLAAGVEVGPYATIGEHVEIGHGAVVIAAITSCTNTSNPRNVIAAGLLAKKANALGLVRKPWVKSSLAPGSKAVALYARAVADAVLEGRANATNEVVQAVAAGGDEFVEVNEA